MATADPRYDITDVLEMSFPHLGEGEREQARELILEHARRLDRIRSGIVMLRVTVDRAQDRPQHGNPYRCRVQITTPGHVEVVAVSEPGDHAPEDPLRLVLKNTFRAAERQLRREQQLQRRKVKTTSYGEGIDSGVGLVVRLDKEAGYGFIGTLDGREIYFHRNAVLHGDFDELYTGHEVRFEEEEGEDGPQATTVQVLSRHLGAQRDVEDVRDVLRDPLGWERIEEPAYEDASRRPARALDGMLEEARAWARQVGDLLGVDEDHGFHALRAVLLVVRDRLTAGEAADVGSRLPTLLRGVFYEDHRPETTPRLELHDERRFLDEVRRRCLVSGMPEGAATRAVLRLLGRELDADTWARLRRALPSGLETSRRP